MSWAKQEGIDLQSNVANLEEVESVTHFDSRCWGLMEEREVLENCVDDFHDQDDEEKVVLILEHSCRDGRAGRWTVERVDK